MNTKTKKKKKTFELNLTNINSIYIINDTNLNLGGRNKRSYACIIVLVKIKQSHLTTPL